MKVIILGGGAAGAGFGPRLRRNDKDIEIKIFEKSPHISYANCGLPYGISGVAPMNKLLVRTPAEMKAKNGIDAFVNHEAISLYRKKKEVTIKNNLTNEEFTESYDKLIIATGARPLELPIENIENEENVFTLKTFADLEKLKAKAEKSKKALVIGGGFIGIEVAEQLSEMKIDVTLVEMRNSLAGYDFDFSSFLEEVIRENNVNLLLETYVKSIDVKNKEALLSDSTKVKYDFIVTSGTKPNTEIFMAAGIKGDEKGIISTNEYMQTNDKDIYAFGDIVYVTNAVTGKDMYLPLAHQAKTQAKIAADHLSNRNPQTTVPSAGGSLLKVFGIPFGKVGLTERDAKKFEIEHRIVMSTVNTYPGYMPGSSKLVFKMIIEEKTKRLLGLQSYGEFSDKKIDVFAMALYSKMTIEDLATINLAYQPWFSNTLDPLNQLAIVALKEYEKGFTSVCPFSIPENGRIIDVRSPENRKAKGHLKGSINIPTSKLGIDTLPDKNEFLYLHCNSGFGSSVAAEKLKDKGYKNIVNVFGGNNLYQLMKRKNKKYNDR